MPYSRPASRLLVPTNPPTTAARAAATAACSWARLAPKSTQGRPWAAIVMREAAAATAQS